jgi:hypothetical protein
MFSVEVDENVLIRLGWLSAVLCARRSVSVEPRNIRSVAVARRGDLEPLIENRVLGIGTSIGRRRRGRTRVGRFLGRPVVGEQFWAVPPGDAETMPLLVVDCDSASSPFARVVCQVDDAEAAASRLRRSAGV